MSILSLFRKKQAERKRREKRGVVISGYFGYKNSGDDASFACIADAIRRVRPDVRVSVLCRSPKEYSKLHGVRGIGRFNPIAIFRELKCARLLISGGGSLMQNTTSTRSLTYYTGIILLAHLCGAKIYICANGIGPISGQYAKKLVYAAASVADFISVRDRSSRTVLSKLGIPSGRISITPDIVFQIALHPSCGIHEFEQRLPLGKHGRYFAVSVRRSGLSADRLSELYRGLRMIMLRLEMIPVFIPMQNYEDSEPTRIAAENTGGEAVVSPWLPHRELCTLLRGAELVLSMRLHLMVYAAISGTPAIGIAVDPKIDAISEQVGFPKPINTAELSANTLFAGAKQALKCDRAGIRHTADQLAKKSIRDVDTVLRSFLLPPPNG